MTAPGVRILRGRGQPNTPERIRTSGLCLRRAALYPAELRAQGAVMIRRRRFRVNPACAAAGTGSGVAGPAAATPHPVKRQEDGRHKPSSVSRLGGGQGSFIWDSDCSEPLAAYPGLGRDRRPLVPYLALLRMGFAVRPLLPAARCALTAPFHPCLCPGGPSAVCSLRHFPSPRGARALPGILPCGARTFLRPASPWAPVGDPSARPPGRALKLQPSLRPGPAPTAAPCGTRPMSAAMTWSRDPDTAREVTTTVNICLYIFCK